MKNRVLYSLLDFVSVCIQKSEMITKGFEELVKSYASAYYVSKFVVCKMNTYTENSDGIFCGEVSSVYGTEFINSLDDTKLD